MNLEQPPLAEDAFNLCINIFISLPSIIFTLKVVQKLCIIKTNLTASSYPTNFFCILTSVKLGEETEFTQKVKIDWSEYVPTECWRGTGRKEWGYLWKVMWLKKKVLYLFSTFTSKLRIKSGSELKIMLMTQCWVALSV